MVPPGVGDIYWSMVKLKSMIEEKQLGIPDVYIMSDCEDKQRSLEYVQSLPFVNAAGFRKMKTRSPIFQEAYMQDGRTLFESDGYFLAYNGVMRFGKNLIDTDPQWPAIWYHDAFRPIEARQYAEATIDTYGEYLVAYFVPHGMYKQWLAQFPVHQIVQVLESLIVATGKKILLIGAHWDVNSSLVKQLSDIEGVVDLTGQTTLQECFELLRSATGVIGYPSGVTIMSTVFKTPTYMLWNEYFHRNFYETTVPPDSIGNWYKYCDTKDATVKGVVDDFCSLIDIEPPELDVPK